MTGLVSVTFRLLTPAQVILLCAESGLEAIEWGGDIHCPPGDEKAAKALGRATRAAGLSTCSYGSYHRLLADPPEAILPVLKTAAALGAPVVRIWAGNTTHGERPRAALLEEAAAELAAICPMAASYGLTIALEKHRGTLTEHSDDALQLLNNTGFPNIQTYWQPNPELGVAENLASIRTLAAYIGHIHVFHWAPDGTRHPLSTGETAWAAYLAALPENPERRLLLEFLPGDDPTLLHTEAATLQRLATGKNKHVR